MDSPIQKWEKSEAFGSVQSSSVLKSSLLPLYQGQGNSLILACVCSLKVVLQSDILLASLVFTLGSCIFHKCLTLFIRYGFYLKLMSFLSLTPTHINQSPGAFLSFWVVSISRRLSWQCFNNTTLNALGFLWISLEITPCPKSHFHNLLNLFLRKASL